MNTLRLPDTDAHLFYHDFPGASPALVMLHGLGSASSSWFPRAARHPRLQTHRCVLVDLLGYGYSDRPPEHPYTMDSQAENVALLLDHLALRDCVVIGHSMGGSIAILLGHARPDLAAHLIIAEGNLDPGPGFVSGRIVTTSEQAFVEEKYDQFIAQMADAGYHDYAGTVRASDPRCLHRSAVSLIADRSPTYRDCLYAFSGARTYVFGERTLPDPDERILRERGIDIRVVPNAGHDMMGDNPEGFACAVGDAIIAYA